MLVGCSELSAGVDKRRCGFECGRAGLGAGAGVSVSAAQVWLKRRCECGSSVACAWRGCGSIVVEAWLGGWGLAGC
jgi:hypothetical protein